MQIPHITLSSIWRWIWKLSIPPNVKLFLWKATHNILPVRTALIRRNLSIDPICKRCGEAEETMEHALRDCPWSTFFWRASPLRLEKLLEVPTASLTDMIEVISKTNKNEVECLFAMLCWSLWYSRNLLVFQEKYLSHQECFNMATRLLQEFQNTKKPKPEPQLPKSPTIWQKPNRGALKINSDASIIQGRGTGIGVVIRDDSGKIVHVFTKRMSQEFPVDIAEALACREALTVAQTLQCPCIQVEMDCLPLVQGLHRNQKNISYLGGIMEDIQDQKKNFSSISFTHINREANKLAHGLAKHAFSTPSCISNSVFVPVSLQHIVTFEAMAS